MNGRPNIVLIRLARGIGRANLDTAARVLEELCSRLLSDRTAAPGSAFEEGQP